MEHSRNSGPRARNVRRQTNPKHTTRFYHFTCRLWWRFIENEGILRGEVPIRWGETLDFPNLTVDPHPAHQEWAWPVDEKLTMFGQHYFTLVNKRAVRIAVDLPRQDPKLVRWVDLAKRMGMDAGTIRRYDEVGGGRSSDWWVYRGLIRPHQFATVDFLDGGQILETEQELIEKTAVARTHEYAMSMMGMR